MRLQKSECAPIALTRLDAAIRLDRYGPGKGRDTAGGKQRNSRCISVCVCVCVSAVSEERDGALNLGMPCECQWVSYSITRVLRTGV